MSESMRMWVEVSFNITYLVVVYGLVAAMIRRRPAVPEDDQPIARLFIWAFALLALGDTGHVGFRVLAYALGDLGASVNLFGRQVGLVGLGALSTAVTVTLFYVLMLVIWRRRFDRPYGWFGALLFIAAAVRFVIMVFPQNQWNNEVPPQPWGIIRNLPLTILGLGVAALMLRDGQARRDNTFKWIAVMIVISYAMYIPVILFVQVAPMVGMLMIPKTLAYVAAGFIAYRDLFAAPQPEARLTAES
ncbi:MAG: hypothetical protein ACK2UH_00530 [Candidatus Promineifilaceae bacterium]